MEVEQPESSNKEGETAKEDDELEKMAMEEILKETKRGAERAKEHGALGWQKSPIPSANKRFLKNMLVGTLRDLDDHRRSDNRHRRRYFPPSDRDYKRRRYSDSDYNYVREDRSVRNHRRSPQYSRTQSRDNYSRKRHEKNHRHEKETKKKPKHDKDITDSSEKKKKHKSKKKSSKKSKKKSKS